MGDASPSSGFKANGPRSDDQHVSIIDICRAGSEYSILNEIRKMLNPEPGREKKMPTMLLYDEQGLKLFEEITYLDEYYLTNAEIEALENHANEIAQYVQPGSQIVELGSGNLRKVKILLQAFESAQKDVEYYALDLSKPELERTLEAVNGLYQYVHCHGLFGTYDDGLAWLQRPDNLHRSKCILWMGSSIGNLNRTEAAYFLRSFTSILHGPDTMLIGMDACQNADKVYHGYNDRLGKTHEFVLNGLTHANRLLEKEAFKRGEWEVIGQYDAKEGRHQAFYSPHRDVEVEGVMIQAGERIRIEESYKYSAAQSNRLWQEAGMMPKARFGETSGEYNLHLVSPVPSLTASLKSTEYAVAAVPSIAEFEQLWLAWDVVTRYMIPAEEQLSKPINLRNCCLFYLGHIPTFLDIYLTKATGDAPTPPSQYQQIFERGIDPDVENPEHCHAHSEVPDEWPPLEEIIAFQGRVRDRTRALHKSTDLVRNRNIGRALWIGFEHEAMHLETLLYMLLQSDKTLPPPGVRPDFEALAASARKEAIPNDWVNVPASTITLGIDDPDNNEGPDHYFGWDSEKPERQVEVGTFEAKARPITNEEYARFLEQNHKDALPASWRSHIDTQTQNLEADDFSNGNGVYMNGASPPLTDAFLNGKFVNTVYGPVPLKHALDWPVFASYDELSSCAAWMGGRIPTAEEVRAIYDYVDANKVKEADSILTRKISAVNGHLSNDGIEISPPSHLSSNGASGAEQKLDPSALFADLEGCNIGFQLFHPTPVTQNGSRLTGRGETGGVWEWTSSTLERWAGFEPMKLYPGYTADFFDGKHNVVLGGSWATHPRIAGRKSFVNWYQRNYLYAWCGARIVRDGQ